jgi:hypothetical protein
MMFMPRRVKTVSIKLAASLSSPGKTISRDETKLTLQPSPLNADANSAPVTPEPTTIMCSGISARL